MADLSSSTVKNSNFDSSDLSRSVLEESELEENNFNNANFIGSNISDSKYFGCQLSGVRVDDDTDFGDLCGYEPAFTEGQLKKAEWSYRAVQQIFQENSLTDQARDYYYKRKERRRERYALEGTWTNWDWIIATVSKWLTGYADRPRNVIGASIGVILAFGMVFPFVGGVYSGSTAADTFAFALPAPSVPTPPQWVEVILVNLYFSTATFTTVGYGDVQPASPATQALAGIESFLGALLMALLVFVLGRRATW